MLFWLSVERKERIKCGEKEMGKCGERFGEGNGEDTKESSRMREIGCCKKERK